MVHWCTAPETNPQVIWSLCNIQIKLHHCTHLHTINYCPWLLHTQKAFNSHYIYSTVYKISLRVVRLAYESRKKSTNILEHIQHSDANGIIVHPCKLLSIVHDCYTIRKPWITILAIVQCCKIQLRVVHLVYTSWNKSTSKLEALQHSDANGIIVHPCKLLIIIHDCCTLRKPLIAILATVPLFEIPLRVVQMV